MTYRDNAKAPYTRQIGDPADGFVTGADAQWSVDLLADEIDTKATTAALAAVTDELGTDPSGASATVKARFEAIEANDWVTSARIAADAVGSSEIAANAVGSSELADNAVDTAAIADGAVTAPKFAAGAMSAVLLAVARAQPVVSGGDAFDGPDPMWETIFGEPFADAGTPSAGTPAHTFDGGAAA